jgi:methenyltetrahydromethanopterin cyclohydrolase
LLEIQNLLIIANSARMLAYKAYHSGYKPIAIDLFADTDTRKFTLECVKVDSLSLPHIQRAFTYIKSKYQPAYVIYGSGFERYVESLNFLHRNLIILGNNPTTFFAAHNKHHFFSSLHRLNIPFPETSFSPPKTVDNWLTKPLQGEGGRDIKKYNSHTEKQSMCYWQKHQIGTPMSVLFIANNKGCEAIGYHKQWTTCKDVFIFSGLISQPDIDDKIKRPLNLWINLLAKEFSLRGLNSLDFILRDKHLYILELNARPSASMQLYDEDLLTHHINSFLDESVALPSTGGLANYQAYKIIFAESDCMINQHIQWPTWASDIPVENTFIHTGTPICSIIACGENEQQVLSELLEKQQIITKLLQ